MELTAKIKLTKKQLQALLSLYGRIIEGLEIPADDHGSLLFEHACELFNKLVGMGINRQDKYTLKLKGSAALAFLQLWKIIPVMAGSHEQVIIAEVIQIIDKVNAHAKIIAHVPAHHTQHV